MIKMTRRSGSIMTTRVSFNMGITLNIGNFESVRLDYGLEDDVREGEKVSEATSRVTKFVEHTLEEKIKSIRKELG